MNGSKTNSGVDEIPQQLPPQHALCAVDKVMNWDTSGNTGKINHNYRSPPHSSPVKSRSRSRYKERLYHQHHRRRNRSRIRSQSPSYPPPPRYPSYHYWSRSRSPPPRPRFVSPRPSRQTRERYCSSPRPRSYRSPSYPRSPRYFEHPRVTRQDVSPHTRKYGYHSPPPRPRKPYPSPTNQRRNIESFSRSPR